MLHPSLRTVRAVLPHTALQSVVSSSGLACQCMGLAHGEKSHLSKESFRCFLGRRCQRRPHALVPHRGFYPHPLSCAGVCALSSPCGHCRRFALALPLCETHASTFLPPVPRRCFTFSASRGCSPLRYHEGSDSCTRPPQAQVSPLTSPHLPVVPPPTTWAAWSSLPTTPA